MSGVTATMETREALPAHLLIKIESCSLLSKCGIQKYETREFAAGNYKWKLIIYPDGNETEKDDDKEEYVSVYLAVADTKSLPVNWDVNVVFSICILNQISGKCLYTLGRTRRFFAMKTEWGFSKFISKKILKDPSSGYLVDDSCVFGAEVFINEYNPVTECLSLKNVTETDHKRKWKISDFSTLKTVWTSEVFTVGDHKWKIQLHPNGTGDAFECYLSIYLHHVASDANNPTLGEKVKASYTVSIKNHLDSHKHHNQTLSHWFSASGTCVGWGWPTFLSLADFNDPNRGFLVKDTCLLKIEMSVQGVAHWSSI